MNLSDLVSKEDLLNVLDIPDIDKVSSDIETKISNSIGDISQALKDGDDYINKLSLNIQKEISKGINISQKYINNLVPCIRKVVSNIDFLSSIPTISSIIEDVISCVDSSSSTSLDIAIKGNKIAHKKVQIDIKRNGILAKKNHQLESIINVLEQDKKHNINKNKLLSTILNFEINGDDNIKDTEGNKIIPAVAKHFYHTLKGSDEKTMNKLDLSSLLDNVSNSYDEMMGKDGDTNPITSMFDSLSISDEDIKSMQDLVDQGVNLTKPSLDDIIKRSTK